MRALRSVSGIIFSIVRTAVTVAAMPPNAAPPSDWKGIFRQLGPGLIISANIVGSGELIVTTKLGANVGFTLLWFIVLGCVIKVFLQIELGRQSVLRGVTTLEVLNSVPGPKFRVSWLVWCWIVMFIGTFFQLGGMVGGLVEIFTLGVAPWPELLWTILIVGSCAALLFIGRYRFIERFATTMVAGFTLFTIVTVVSLYWTDYGITSGNIAEGLQFRLPADFTIAFAAFGIIGVGASELIYYPYWCLEKGYAKQVGPNDGTPEWQVRAQGWLRVLKWDAALSLIVYTVATVAFYLLGAAVLHAQDLKVEDSEMIATLSELYRTSFGQAGLVVFLIGATAVLYSTVFISTASNARLSVDLLRIGRLLTGAGYQDSQKYIRIACVLLPALYLLLYLSVGKPVSLVLIGALAQALILPLICFAVLWLRYSVKERPADSGGLWMSFLWLSCLLMTAVGVYQLADKLGGLLLGGD